jgi:hypothetical protein
MFKLFIDTLFTYILCHAGFIPVHIYKSRVKYSLLCEFARCTSCIVILYINYYASFNLFIVITLFTYYIYGVLLLTFYLSFENVLLI